MKRFAGVFCCLWLAFIFAACGETEALQPSSLPSASVQSQQISSESEADLTPSSQSSQGEPEEESKAGQQPANEEAPEEEIMKINVQVGNETFTATAEQNRGAEAFLETLCEGPVSVELSEYGGFEKVGPLGFSLPTENSQITARPGDIILYNGNQISLFYGANSWSYTRLGVIDDLSGWAEALGSGDVTVTFSLS